MGKAHLEGFMKKFLVLFLAMTFATGIAVTAKADDGIGLELGLEFGIGGINKPDGADDVLPYLEPSIEYTGQFMNDALDVYAKLAYNFGFIKEYNKDGEKVFPMGLYFNIGGAYHLALGPGSTVSFLVENEDFVSIAPKLYSDFSDHIMGTLKLGVMYDYNMDIGNIFAKVVSPISYAYIGSDKIWVGLDANAGWISTFGLGLFTNIHFLFTPDSNSGYSGLDIIASYETGPFYGEVEVSIPNDIANGGSTSFFDDKGSGISITPEIRLAIFNSFSAYINCKFDQIGVDDRDINISPALGIRYRF
jgi:small basic protein